ncbi:hypothetical protein HFO49_26095 [Rhizobium leguminosarum]|uniref:hypothetical protein n=1 Tax=Rhizobium leguminosarum TaxID=384 RepID=UPI001C975A3C|nr:hypothetical protein [Rhizobium leguminosarum]MBY5590916.1 hypothetical protein [Rhizobium leguminosarum]
MITRSGLFHLWKRQVFLRNRHEDFDALLSMRAWMGIYLIGCANEIVYVGQTSSLDERPIQSLGNIYHRVDDTSLPWSIAFAPCQFDEMNERESSAIRAFAPRFNTSIPNTEKSNGRLPEIVASGAVFQDQNGPCGAFSPESLRRQMERALENPNPPWARKRTRTKTTRKAQCPAPPTQATPVEWTKEDSDLVVRDYGVPIDEPFRYPINLCSDGSVVTRDGEFLGTWTMDEHEHPSFTPEGASEPLLSHVLVGLLCLSIREWHEAIESGPLGAA